MEFLSTKEANRRIWGDLRHSFWRQRPRVWPLVVLVGLLLVLVWSTACQAQTPLVVITGTRAEWRAAKAEARASNHSAGETTCTARGTDARQLWGLTHADSSEVAAHEAIHARQLAANCDSVMAVWQTDPRAKMEAEAEALCGGMREADVPRSWWHGRKVRAAAFWGRFSSVSFDQALLAYDRFCGDDP